MGRLASYWAGLVSTIASVRSVVAAHLLASGLGLVRESQETIESIRAETHSPVHLEFAIGSPGESFAARNAQSKTDLVLVIPYHLAPKDRVTSGDAALTLERAVLAALQVSAWSAPRTFGLCAFRSVREAGADGWVWIVVTFTALHATL